MRVTSRQARRPRPSSYQRLTGRLRAPRQMRTPAKKPINSGAISSSAAYRSSSTKAGRRPKPVIISKIAAMGRPTNTAKPMPKALAYWPNGAPVKRLSTASHSGVSQSRAKPSSRRPTKGLILPLMRSQTLGVLWASTFASGSAFSLT